MNCKICILIILSLLGSIINLGIHTLITLYIKKNIHSSEREDIENLSNLSIIAFIGGFLEIFLYCSSIIINKPELIFLWIGVKTALKWERKRNDDSKNRDVKFRGLYYRFLIGNSISIIMSYLIACILVGKMIYFI